jgi:hypothetical protein
VLLDVGSNRMADGTPEGAVFELVGDATDAGEDVGDEGSKLIDQLAVVGDYACDDGVFAELDIRNFDWLCIDSLKSVVSKTGRE